MFAIAAAEFEHFTQVTKIRRNRHVEVAGEPAEEAAAHFHNLHNFDAGELFEQSLDHPQRSSPFGFIPANLERDWDILFLNDLKHPAPALQALAEVQRRRVHRDHTARLEDFRPKSPALYRQVGSA